MAQQDVLLSGQPILGLLPKVLLQVALPMPHTAWLLNTPLRRAETSRLKVSMYFELSNPNVLRIRSWGLDYFVVIVGIQCWQPNLEVVSATVLARFDPRTTLQHTHPLFD
jgi:hypothetical protein